MAKRLGTQVARAIVAGDVTQARELARELTSVSVAEGRAITGAVRHSNARYGSTLVVEEFFAPERKTHVLF